MKAILKLDVDGLAQACVNIEVATVLPSIPVATVEV